MGYSEEGYAGDLDAATAATLAAGATTAATGGGRADDDAQRAMDQQQASPSSSFGTSSGIAVGTSSFAPADLDDTFLATANSDTIRVAEIAARTAEAGDGGQASLQVSVIPTRTQVEGIAALAVHEPGRTFAADVTEMTATARHVRSGAVTVAAKAAMTMAGPCQPGDVLGVISGEFVIVGSDLAEVAATLTDRLLGGGGELVTLVAGAEAGDLLERCSAHLAQAHPHVDVVVFDGGQPRYPLLLSVE